MPELKRVFSKAIMNKDLDERLVPNGQHRDALNVQIATSDGSDVGAVQTLMGNTLHNTMASSSGVYSVNTRSTCVGSIASPDKDKIYYFVDAGTQADTADYNDIRKDYILEYDVINNTHKYVFVDIYNVKVTIASATSNTDAFLYIPDNGSSTINTTGVRVGMSVSGTIGGVTLEPSHGVTVHNIIYDTGNSRWKIVMAKNEGSSLPITNTPNLPLTSTGQISWQPVLGVEAGDVVHFTAPRVLNFNKNILINAINILDDFLYWTDNHNEPKKINIPRSIAGTGGLEPLVGQGTTGWIGSGNDTSTSEIFTGDTDYFHTRLVRDKSRYVDSSAMEIVTIKPVNIVYKLKPVYVEEKHITVIKKPPIKRLKLEMSNTNPTRINSEGVANATSVVWDETFPEEIPDEPMTVNFGTPVDFRKDDIILIRQADFGSWSQSADMQFDQNNFEEYDIRAQVVQSNTEGPNNVFSQIKIKILSKVPNMPLTEVSYVARLDDINPLFEFKFPRFSYRYKYEDGEYSTFAPWSRIAFLTDDFEWEPVKGYNFGMVNQVRSLVIKNYHGKQGIIPEDVVEIDILYKETNNPTVYTVKTLKPSDGHPIWPDRLIDESARGAFRVTTDMIHAVVPSNQLLRPWDNVPRKALAQEISANRLIYGNYLQNYTVTKDPIVNLELISRPVQFGAITNPAAGVAGSISQFESGAYPSVKSNRTYQAGVVFSDGYGRETPVLTHENATVRVPKNACASWNRLKFNLTKQTEIPSWAKYYSFYIKETSVEYHNLAMDRWYDAWDGNIWLSFPSSDRNKVDEETFLVLKKQHGNDTAVTEDARYKILAIENEAPDYIKTVGKSFGYAPGGQDGAWTVGSSGGAGWPYVGSMIIDIQDTAFNTAFGESFLDTTKEGLTVLLRGGEGLASVEYPVSSIVLSGGDYTISLERPIGEDGAWAAPTGEASSRIESLQIELIGHEVENRPEFDGRFFVKVFKDQHLQDYVLSLSNPEAMMVVTDSFDIGYLNNNAHGSDVVNNSGESTTTHYTSVSADSFFPNKLSVSSAIDVGNPNENSYGNYHKHPTEHGYHRNHSDGEYQWYNSYVTASDILNSPLHLNTNAQDFWDWVGDKEIFFIDAASAFSLTGYDNDHDGRWGYQSSPTDDDWNDLGVSPLSGADSEGGLQQADDSSSAHADTFGSIKKGFGLGGRGLWEPSNHSDASCIDISWSGMGSGWRDELESGSFNDSNLTYGLIHQQLGLVPNGGQNGHSDDTTYDDGVNYDNAWTFIQKLIAPGTVFKFSSDPEAVEYTVQGTSIPAGAVGSENVYLDGFNTVVWKSGANKTTGHWGIRNFGEHSGEGSNQNVMWRGSNIRQRWSIMVSPKIGSVGSVGYNPVTGTNPPAQGGPAYSEGEYRRALHHDLSDSTQIQILEPYYNSSGYAAGGGKFVENPAVWETEPKESVDLDIYYQVSDLIPLKLTMETNEEFLPIGSTFNVKNILGTSHTFTIKKWVNARTFEIDPDLDGFDEGGTPLNTIMPGELYSGGANNTGRRTFKINGSRNNLVTLSISSGNNLNTWPLSPSDGYQTGNLITVQGGVEMDYLEAGDFWYQNNLFAQEHTVDWNNCWTWGNGVESDRIRDDFNAPRLDNGVKASSIIEEQAREERRKHGLIWSGIYNSNAGINNTNQFIQAEPITKDLNPIHGSIQALLNRDTRLIMFCEDKILRADTNRDLLFNADGNSQLVGSNKVVGSAVAYQGNYGISKNPESMVNTPYRTYFTDINRNQVLSLSNEGIRSISDIGMKDYFRDTMKENVWRSLGTYDPNKGEYNLTISKKYSNSQISPHEQITASFSERSNGWISFKSFYPQDGVGVNDQYYTFSNGQIYKHHDNEVRNNFYGVQGTSDITVLFNDTPNSVKNFATINYEGTNAKITQFSEFDGVQFYNGDYTVNSGITSTDNVYDDEYFNLEARAGWYVDNITTNLQTCSVTEFKDKEGKWFGVPAGVDMDGGSESLVVDNKGDYTVQGIGIANTLLHSDASYNHPITITVEKSLFTTTWDSTSTLATETSLISCTSNTLTATSGAAIGSNETVELTVSPVGTYPLAAANLEIEGATASIDGSNYVYTNDGTTNVGTTQGLANAVDIDTITFSDNGTPSDPGNTVKVIVKFKQGENWPTESAIYRIDIDLKPTAPVAPTRKACLRVFYNFHDTTIQDTPAYADIGDITESQESAGSTVNGEQGPTNKHTGIVPDNANTEIATYTFERNGNYYYGEAIQVKYFNLGLYGDPMCYTDTIEKVYTDGLVTGFTVRIFYSPPQSLMLINDPEDFCAENHRAQIQYTVIEPESDPTDSFEDATILKVEVQGADNLNHAGGDGMVKVTGTPGAGYNLYLEKKTSLTSTTTAGSGGYFNFPTDSFQDAAPDSLNATISSTVQSSGDNYHLVTFPPVTAATRYDVTVDGGPVEGTMSTLASGIPTAAGDEIIIQSGLATVAFEDGADTTDNFDVNSGGAANIIRSAGSNVSARLYKQALNTVKGSHSSGVTKIKLGGRPKKIEVGMYVMNPFGQVDGGASGKNAIKHGTTVLKIYDNEITISDALEATLADGSDLQFVSKNSSVVPFSIAVAPGSGITNIDGVKTSVDWEATMAGMSTKSILTNAVCNNSSTIVLRNIKGIVPGMKVIGKGIVGTNNAGFTYVTAIASSTSITVSSTENLPNSTTLMFLRGDTSIGATSGMEPGLKLLHVQARRNSSSSGTIEGYIKTLRVDDSINIPIYTGDIFTTS